MQKTIFSFLYYMGVRRSELLALQWKDIDLVDKSVKIYKTHTTKVKDKTWDITSPKTGNSTRTISMPAILCDLMTQWKKDQSEIFGFNEERYVFGFS